MTVTLFAVATEHLRQVPDQCRDRDTRVAAASTAGAARAGVALPRTGYREGVTTQAQPLFAGRYELGQLLGGGTADVYLGTDTRLRRPVVVKIARSGPEIEDVDRFDNEMRLLAGLHDPGLVTLYDAGTVDGRAYLVMQYVPGGTLGERLHREGALPADEVSRIGTTLAEALAYLHEHQVIHRDIKPGNVLIDQEGTVRLGDFGIARTVDAARVTATGLVIGTPAYLSPEQARGEPATPASDLYALGLVLLECLTGRREYVGAPLEVAVARLHRPPSVPQDLPDPWPGLLSGLTAGDPAVRPGARQVADVLAGRATTPLPAVVAEPARSAGGVQWASPPAAAAHRRRRAGVVAGLATAGLAAAAAGAVILSGALPGGSGGPGGAPNGGSSAPATPKTSMPAGQVANQPATDARGSGNRGPGRRPDTRRSGNSGRGSGSGGGSSTSPAAPTTPPATSGPADPPTSDPPTSDPPTDPPPTTDAPPAGAPSESVNPGGGNA